MRVAIVHDDLTQRGGAERVVLALGRLFPHAPVLTSVYDPAGTFPELSSRDVRTSFMQRLADRGAPVRALLPLYPVAFDRMDLSGFDLVVSSSTRFAHGVRVPDGHHLVYCHSPGRFLYWPETYFGRGGPAPAWARTALAPVLAAQRRWDRRVAAQRPDTYVANSLVTRQRIAEVYGRHDVEVVYPPIDVAGIAARIDALGPGRPSVVPAEPYFLVVSRLLPYKRVDLAAAACTRLGARLVVVGQGPAESEVRRVAGPTVEIRRDVADAELSALLAHCTAVVQAGQEDLGMVPLEANAAGRPAVAYGALGALETVHPGETGLLFDAQEVDALCDALERVGTIRWDVDRLRAHAATHDEAHFAERLRAVLGAAGVGQ